MGSGPPALKLPLKHVREGCTVLIQRIQRHARHSEVLLKAERVRGAYIFILTGFEEIGKIFSLIEAAAQAEAGEASEVLVRDFRQHDAKALQSSRFIGMLATITDAAFTQVLGSDYPEQADYLDHIADIGKNFVKLRSGILYVDYSNGEWTRDRPPDKKLLYQDVASLDGMTKMLEDSMRKHPTFTSLWSYFSTDNSKLVSELAGQLKAFIGDFMSESRQDAGTS